MHSYNDNALHSTLSTQKIVCKKLNIMHSYNDNALHSALSTQKIDSSHPREEKATWNEV